jgi:hypothetical protein
VALPPRKSANSSSPDPSSSPKSSNRQAAPAPARESNRQPAVTPAARPSQRQLAPVTPAKSSGRTAAPSNNSSAKNLAPAKPAGQSSAKNLAPAKPAGQSSTKNLTPAKPAGQSSVKNPAPAKPAGQSSTRGSGVAAAAKPAGQSSARGSGVAAAPKPAGQPSARGSGLTAAPKPAGQSSARGSTAKPSPKGSGLTAAPRPPVPPSVKNDPLLAELPDEPPPESTFEPQSTPPLKSPSSSSRRLEAAKKPNGSSRRLQRLDATEKLVQPAEAARTPASSRRTVASGSGRQPPASSDRPSRTGPAVSGREAGRTQRASMRDTAPKPPLLTKKHYIIMGVVAALILVGVLAYPYVHKSMLLSDVRSGNTRACAELLAGWRYEAIATFGEYLKPPPPELQAERTAATRTAAAQGLGMAIRVKELRESAIAALKPFLDGEEEQRRLAAQQFLDATDYVLEKRDGELMGQLAPSLFACVNSSDPEVKKAGLMGLSKYQTPGGCARLLKAAKEEKGEFRAMALRGVEISAAPDALAALLQAMTDAKDKDLADAALRGFTKVRDKALTSQLTPLLANQPDAVRLVIVQALAARVGDSDATKGIVIALADATPAIRVEAVKALPPMRPLPTELARLEPLIADANEDVSLATAKCIEDLRDDVSWKLLLGAFQKNLDGKRLEAYLKALGVRGAARYIPGKPRDLMVTAIPIALLETKPQAKDQVVEALVLLTRHHQYPQRATERREWSIEKWKTWQANGLKRHQAAQTAIDTLEDARRKQGMEFQSEFPQLYKSCEAALKTLEDCREQMCQEDPEEASAYESLEMEYSKLKFHFFKDQHL